MPFVFGIVGTLLVVSGVRGTTSELASLVKTDFTGTPNYLEWMVAIFIVGSVGYIDKLHTLSRAFMVLLIIVLFLAEHGGFAQQFFSAFTTGVESPTGSQYLGSSGEAALNPNINAGLNLPATQTTSVQPSDTLQLGESLLSNSGI